MVGHPCNKADLTMSFSKLNYINVGPRGTFRPSGDLHTTPQDIDALFNHLSQHSTKKLVVHFHGGLVNEGAGLDIARSMQPVYEEGGAHAVTFIWETGLVETLTRNMTRIGETRLFQKFVRYVFRQLTKRLGADLSGRGAGEPMTMKEIEDELSRLDGCYFERFDATARSGSEGLDETDLDYLEDEMANEYLVELQGDREFSDSPFEELAGDTSLADDADRELRDGGGRGLSLFALAKYLAKITYRVLKRYLRKRDHGLYPTVIEEILREFYLADFGAWAWGRMKNVAGEMWLPNGVMLDDDAHPGTYFLEKLLAHQWAHPDFTLDLVGHSAGSIAICHMLRSAGTADRMPKIRHIVFLAPACVMTLFYEEVVAHPNRYSAFRMYTMSDAYEQQDRLVGGLYTRSLLYLISGVLEDKPDTPLAGMERFWTGAAPFDKDHLRATADWLKNPTTHRSVLSVTKQDTGTGLRSSAIKHGDFDNDPLTRSSLTHLVGRT